MKTIKPIEWKTWEPQPGDFPCLHCGSGRQATLMVTITGKADQVYNLPLCPVCAQLPADVLVPGLKEV